MKNAALELTKRARCCGEMLLRLVGVCAPVGEAVKLSLFLRLTLVTQRKLSSSRLDTVQG